MRRLRGHDVRRLQQRIGKTRACLDCLSKVLLTKLRVYASQVFTPQFRARISEKHHAIKPSKSPENGRIEQAGIVRGRDDYRAGAGSYAVEAV